MFNNLIKNLGFIMFYIIIYIFLFGNIHINFNNNVFEWNGLFSIIKCLII